MKLSTQQIDRESLAQFGAEAIALVESRSFSKLAERFGYALAYGRDLVQAIEEDFERCLSEADGNSGRQPASIKVSYFNSNSIPLFALVEGVTSVNEHASVLIELVVTGNGEEKNITLEQISHVAQPCNPPDLAQGR